MCVNILYFRNGTALNFVAAGTLEHPTRSNTDFCSRTFWIHYRNHKLIAHKHHLEPRITTTTPSHIAIIGSNVSNGVAWPESEM